MIWLVLEDRRLRINITSRLVQALDDDVSCATAAAADATNGKTKDMSTEPNYLCSNTYTCTTASLLSQSPSHTSTSWGLLRYLQCDSMGASALVAVVEGKVGDALCYQ